VVRAPARWGGEHEPDAGGVENARPGPGLEKERQTQGVSVEGHRPLDVVDDDGDLADLRQA